LSGGEQAQVLSLFTHAGL